MRKIETPENMPDIWQIDCDVNGNSRYVVHYLAIPYGEYSGASILDYREHQIRHVEHARKSLHGKRYRARQFGGGIVFQAYAGNPVEHLRDSIARGMSAL